MSESEEYLDECEDMGDDCPLLGETKPKYKCHSCGPEGYDPADCACCGRDCCLVWHDKHRPETMFCERCAYHCDPENGDLCHESGKESEEQEE